MLALQGLLRGARPRALRQGPRALDLARPCSSGGQGKGGEGGEGMKDYRDEPRRRFKKNPKEVEPKDLPVNKAARLGEGGGKEARLEGGKEVAVGEEGSKEVWAPPTLKEVVEGGRKPTYDVAWPERLAGEVQVMDSEPPVKVDVRKRLKGVGIMDIGTEDHPYPGHSSTAPYPIPTKAPPLGPSRLEVWKSLGIESVPQLVNRPPDPGLAGPGLGGRVVDQLAEVIHGSPRYLAPRHLIMENTDLRSITSFPPLKDECTQVWYEDPAEETTMGFPVIRAPHPFDRIREGMRIRKSSPEKYPWIQDFSNRYDVLIVGGGLVGSTVAHMLTSRVDTSSGVKVGIIEKDPSYRYSLSTCSPCGIRMQHGLPETIEASLFGSDFLRQATTEMAVAGGLEDDEEQLNVPNIKLQPHGHLTLATQDDMEQLTKDHEMQKSLGVQTALLTVKQLNRRFPWLNTSGIAGGCLGLESEGWMDNWNLLQSLKLRNITQGVDYIHGEVIFMRKHSLDTEPGQGKGMGRFADGSECALAQPYECHVLLPGTKKVYPIEFAQCVVAAGGESGNVARMAGIGEGTGLLSVEVPVERRRQYVYQVHSPEGPGLNLPLTTDPSGLVVRRQGHCGDYLVTLLPGEGEEVGTNMWGDAEPEHWEEVVLPLLQARIKGFEHPVLQGSYPVDYDYNYYDHSPIVGRHPVMDNIFLACGLGGLGAHLAPAVGRGITELIYDQGYTSLDLSRYAFDRILNGATIKENFFSRPYSQARVEQTN